MSTNYPINPRIRAYGKARIDIADRAKNPTDWEKLWKLPSNSFPFVWGEAWKQCVEYRVDDFAAEVGFFIDVLGLPVNAFDPGYAMFTSPQRDFFFAVVPTPHSEQSTPPDAIRLQFMVNDILATTHELEQRGISFEQLPQPLRPGSSLSIGYFRTPHGISIELWGMVKAATSPDVKMSLPNNHDDGDGNDEDDESGEGDLVEDEGDNGDEHEPLEDEDEDEEPGQENAEIGDDDELAEDEGEDDEDDEFLEDEDYDDEFEDDDDEDEFDQDEYSSSVKSAPQKASLSSNQKIYQDTKSKVQDKPEGNQKVLPLEYIDLDIT
jgi:catechol 2,3-dioxygenase-like lactoylglutathione lyase family enzyme